MEEQNLSKRFTSLTGLDPSGLNPQDYDYRSNSIEDFSKTMLFSPLKIGTLPLTHRMVKSTASSDTWDDEGRFEQDLVPYYEQFAKGGVELVWVENYGNILTKFPNPAKRALTTYPNKVLVDVIHKYGAYAGHQFESMGATIGAGQQGAGGLWSQGTSADLTLADIKLFQRDVIEGAKIIKDAGYDAFEFNSAGWNIGQSFLSCNRNTRTDEYGPQSYENRARFLSEIIKGIKKECGKDFVVQVLINGIEENDQFIGDSATCNKVEDTIEFAKLFEAVGVDSLHLRPGTQYKHPAQFAADLCFTGFGINGTTSFGTQYDFSRHWQGKLISKHSGCGLILDVAAEVKKAVSIPVGAVTYMDPAHAPDFFENALKQGKVDFFLMTRALTADFNYVNKLRAGKIDEIAPCTRCLHCHENYTAKGERTESCRVNATIQRANRKKRYFQGVMLEGYDPLPAEVAKEVMVVGGGPAGMEAARIAAERGHKVTLYEKKKSLGELISYVAGIKGPHENLEDWRAYLIRQLDLKGVKVVTGKEVDTAFIQAQKPDVVLLAVGGKQPTTGLAATAGTNIVHRYGATNSNEIGEKVVIIGGSCQAVDIGMYLLAQGKHVSFVHADPYKEGEFRYLSKGHSHWVADFELPIVFARGAHEYTESQVSFVGDGEVTVTTPSGDRVIKCDTIIEVMDLEPNKELLSGLSDIEAYAIGDCEKPWNFAEAVATGNLTARKI